MLGSMRQLALDALWVELEDGKSSDPEAWYQGIRESDLGKLFPRLVEDVEQAPSAKDKQRFSTLMPDPTDANVAILEAHEFKSGDAPRLPFNQPSGAQAAALGPLVKRTPPSKTKPAGPSSKIQQTTLKAFEAIANEGQAWGPYFRAARDCFQRSQVKFKNEVRSAAQGAFAAAIEWIEEKRTVLLAYQQADGKLPGEVPEYTRYLQEVLAETKYATGQIPPCPDSTCALCGCESVVVYPNALRGAGINLANLDRDGAFPGLDPAAAWKGFALCVGCADLLYVYWNHVAGDFLAPVAGYSALVIPSLCLSPPERKKFVKRLRKWVDGLARAKPGEDRTTVERDLLLLLGEERAVTTLTILWAEFGQRIDDIRGLVTDVLPSRLRHLSSVNLEVGNFRSPVFPDVPPDECQYDLSLSILRPLLRRPGGKKAQSSNDSRRLFDLRRDLADAIYHKSDMPERFLDEAHETARWHWDDVCASGKAWGLLHEGHSEKSGQRWLTAAGWVRQLARFLHYLRMIGVKQMPDPETLYQPGCDILKPYCGRETAIDSPQKAFAFILGALYGKLLQVQAARGVNVVSNALTWLKRLTLAGADLPELYVKVREKMMLYGVEGSPTVRELVAELGTLGTRLGTDIKLDETQTCYFLLLGQSLATRIMPSRSGEEEEENANA